MYNIWVEVCIDIDSLLNSLELNNWGHRYNILDIIMHIT